MTRPALVSAIILLGVSMGQAATDVRPTPIIESHDTSSFLESIDSPGRATRHAGLISMGQPLATSYTSSSTISARQKVFNEGFVAGVGAMLEEEPWINVKRYGAVGDGMTDDTAAIQVAIDAAGANSLIFVPMGTYKTTSTLLISNDRVNFVGAGPYATKILFAPSTDDTCLEIHKGDSTINQGSLKDMTFYSADSTHVKVAVDLVDVKTYCIENVVIGGTIIHGEAMYWSGDDPNYSSGLRVRGRDSTVLKRIHVTADKPIVITDNPNNSIDIDHFHFQDCVLTANANPVVTIDGGVNLTNVCFDGYQAWSKGTDGLYWADTRTSQVSVMLTLENVRWEQAENAASYVARIEHNHTLYGLTFRNCYGEAFRNGYYLRKVVGVSFDGVHYGGGAGRIALDVDATVKKIVMRNCFWQAGGSASLVGQNPIWVTPLNPNTAPLPANAYYDEIANAARVTTVGPLAVANGTVSAGFVRILDDIDHGANYAEITVPALADSIKLTLPGEGGWLSQMPNANGSGALTFRYDVEDVNNVTTDTTNFDTHGLHIISSDVAEITGSLMDGTYLGQRVKFVCKRAGHNIDISVGHHVTSAPEVIRLDAAREWVELVWDGTDWVETGGSGQTYP